jgi:hypothetical protein
MKNWTIIIFAVYFGTIEAQEKLDILTTPNSPAVSILGMQPSAILNPKSYRGLEAALFSNFSNENGTNAKIPNDFGLEFMPYWANDHGISLEEYLYPEVTFDQILRNSSFSLASTQNFLLQDSTTTKSLAFGYRTSLFFGNKKDKEIILKNIKTLTENQLIGSKVMSILLEMELTKNYKTKEEYLLAIREVLTKRIYEVLNNKSMKYAEEITKNIYDSANELSFDNNNLNPFFIAFGQLIENKMMGSYEEFKSYIQERQGLSIDLAYAALLNFPDNDFTYSEVTSQSLWITPTYNFSDKINFLKTTGVLRYEWYNTNYFDKYFPDSKVYRNNFDYGLSILAEFKKFSLGFETTGRESNTQIRAGSDSTGNKLYYNETDSDFQYIGTFSYRLTEQIALTYQFGNSFKPIFTTNGTLISLLSLNFGFGGPKTTDVILK